MSALERLVDRFYNLDRGEMMWMTQSEWEELRPILAAQNEDQFGFPLHFAEPATGLPIFMGRPAKVVQ